MWREYINAVSTEQILDVLTDKKEKARLIAGGTDLVLEMEQGMHPEVETLIDISRVPGYDEIVLDEEGWIHLGPTVSHNDCVASRLIRDYALPLSLASWEVGAPQIKNAGTVIGNVVTASPANDTIVPLIALDAELVLLSREGERIVSLEDFYTGVRKTVLKADEIVREIRFRKMAENQRGTYLKMGLRKVQAISVVSMAMILTEGQDGVEAAQITLGAVAPTIIHAREAEEYLAGKQLSDEVIEAAAELGKAAAAPIDDVRSSAEYRKEISRVLVRRGLTRIRDQQEGENLPEEPVLLITEGKQSPGAALDGTPLVEGETPIITQINGKGYTFHHGHQTTLLHLIREHAGLTGSKPGCEEGECGACTVFLDGEAVMSCMIPAPRAHGADIVTIEGLSDGDRLHPVQESFIDQGAVQCGYCTPGFIMSAAKLLEEKPHPTREQIHTAVSGNLCRCTGYYKIVSAIEKASLKEGA